MPIQVYSQTKESLFSFFETSERGLSAQEAQERIQKYGPNKLTVKKKISPITIFARQFKNLLTIILLFAGLFTFVVYFYGGREKSDIVEGSLILGIVVLIAIFGFVQEYRAEKAIEELKKLLSFKTKVVRDAIVKEITTDQLVPGDIVTLEEGEKIPADIRLFSVSNFETNEASMTGESFPVRKTAESLSGDISLPDQKNMVFSGTTATSGRALGLVVATGDKTEIGRIAAIVAETKEEPSHIQQKLNHLAKILGLGTVGICSMVFVFIVLLAENFSHLSLLERILQSFIASVALAVAAIPEGLPAVVTISLAFGTQRMLKRNALVRKLNSMETLGSVDVICCDKTGTLTTGEMTVREIFFDGQTFTISGEGFLPEGDFFLKTKKVDPEVLSLILKAGASCNNAAAQDGRILGDPTEVSLIIAARKAGLGVKFNRIFEIPFSSERKMMSVLVEDQAGKTSYSKGAPEKILPHCTKIIRDGRTVELTEKLKQEVLDQNKEMASRALRVLGFAYKTNANQETLEKDLTFIGLQAMFDPPRKEIKDLISTCRTSGIRVVMITGDQIDTAEAVAAQTGLSGEAITGSQLEQLSREEFAKKVENINIYARVNPEQKFKIVEALKEKGHLVAMTGDGVNDAPALKRSDIGIAMGITGTDVAKESSDIVLLDDQFKTIVAAIEEGRGIFDNIRRFVDYLLSCNVGEVLVVFLGLLIFRDVPLTAVMLLWINIVTDGLPAIALGLDPAEEGIMRFSPKKFQGEIISKRVWVEIAFFSLALTVSVLTLYFLNLREGVGEARAAAFISIVLFELIRLFNIRSAYKISWLSNIWLPIGIASSIILQLVIVYTPLFASWFKISPIDMFDWIYIFLVGGLLILVFKAFDYILNRLNLA